ncbi:prepilin peptidase [Candidatus Venteria ishoeyi]|uniref:Prepilin leader peptidase/N-methyltransferase n=1 Tax=Candidatus Venteria ishoeyi TaxID=1899563 RepID=A0A1H6FEN0_9GAMM|nr:A24 family peptidase [Candidatus Venteria ishoeyi]MDM8547655.1 A24 family peptidase [Candidatus Venteria ishoeyi]SEH07464.1 Type 4 prepilin-like proteins leader peptide-processing enzyme [Candidatus Venteria ishoeyi]
MIESLTLLEQHPLWLTGIAGLLGLVVGSFLNVVIYRLPLIMEREWQEQCAEYLECPDKKPEGNAITLSRPGSHCPHCGHEIRPWENIPVLSFLIQMGRCSQCREKISWRYPAIESLSAVLSLALAWQLGFGWPLLFGLFFLWALLALTFIDLDKQLLPDQITLPLLWLGIILSFFNIYTPLAMSVIGAIAGYLVLWSVYWGFKLLTGKEGMGYGDFKLLAALGAWFGWQALPLLILLASISGAVFGLAFILFFQHDRRQPIPFGPYLAFAGWVMLMWGQSLMFYYQQWLRF